MDDFLASWQAWHDEREERLRSPVGWLSITAIHWLSDAPERYDDVPGAWSFDERGVNVTLDAGETLGLDGESLAEGTHLLPPIDGVGITVTFDDAIAQVAARGSRYIVRPRHPDSPGLTSYRGTPCYPADTTWVLPGRYEAYAEPDGDAIGELVFEHAGVERRLVAWDGDEGKFWILFRDATTGRTTHESNRQLVVEAPAPDGSVRIDFNRAINMPCAYTEFATCPVPPAANRLAFAVEAGEQIPLTR